MSRPNFSEQDLEAIKRRLIVRSGGARGRGGVRERDSSVSSGQPGSIPAPSPIAQSFTLWGQLCSGKNQIQRLWRNGKMHNYPNKTFENWRASAQQDILQQCGLRTRIDVPVVLTCHYTPGDRRTRDLTGQLDAIFHLLVYAQVLKDDGLVHEQHWHRLAVDRAAPQVTIYIQPLCSNRRSGARHEQGCIKDIP